MRSGVRNCPVDIVRNTPAGRDPLHNTPIYTPTNWRTGVFGQITPRRGREVEIKGQIQAETYLRFDFEYFDVIGIRETDVIVYDGVRYGITAILPDTTMKEYIAVDTVVRPTPTED